MVESSLLDAAGAGNADAFEQLTAPYTRELHLHCYRMLGSFDDAEDALQEALLRAWRGMSRFERRSSVRTWLYTIATNVCLTATERARRAPPLDEGWVLSPYPDHLLEELPADEVPAAGYDLAESVQLAFLAAIQLLPPRQRAVLILRDVLGFAAAEVATLLGTTTDGVNSALKRARSRLEDERRSGRLRMHRSPGDAAERSLLRRWVETWERVDIEGFVALMREDATMAMPPERMRFEGSVAIGGFFATVPLGGALDRIRLVETRANAQPALAAYVPDERTGSYTAYGVMVLTLEGSTIVAITGFPGADSFPRLGLPLTIPA